MTKKEELLEFVKSLTPEETDKILKNAELLLEAIGAKTREEAA